MNIFSKSIDKRQRFEWIIDALSLGAVLHYCAYRFLQSTMFVIYYSQMYKILTMTLLLIFGGSRYLYKLICKWKEKDNSERKKYALEICGVWFLALPFFYVGWKHDYKFLIFLPFCCMCIYDMHLEKVLKSFVVTITVLLSATVLCSLCGSVRNLVNEENGRIIGAYGIVNTTDFASYCTFLLLFLWCIIQDNNRFAKPLFAFFVAITTYAVYLLTNSRTALICGALETLLVVWEQLEKGRLSKKHLFCSIRKKFDSALLFIFPALGITMLILVFCYARRWSWAESINSFLTERLAFTYDSYQEYGIHLFGSKIEKLQGVGSTLRYFAWGTGYGYLDVAYAMLAIRYGLIITIIVTGFWVWLSAKALYCGKRRILFSMVILAIHAVSESRFLDVNYNILLIMPFCAMLEKRKEETDLENVIEKRNVIKRVVIPSTIISIVIVLLILILLPRVLSWIRTFLYLNSWNTGTQVWKALLFCVSVVIILSILVFMIIHITNWKYWKKTGKRIFFIAILLLIGCSGWINHCINDGISKQEQRLDKEEELIRLIQKNAVGPVFAAEASELYQRRYGGFTEHLFSTDELAITKNGTIITDARTEALSITVTGGKFFQISPWSGLYTYDDAIVDTLVTEGYAPYTFYCGSHEIDLGDVALFNNLRLDSDGAIILSEGSRIITSNAETDQFTGRYEALFSVMLNSEYTEGDKICALEVYGQAGEQLIYKEDLYFEDFDSNGKCVKRITYTLQNTPKISYSVSATENGKVRIEGISWKHIY